MKSIFSTIGGLNMRPRYETKKDLQNEKLFTRKYSNQYDFYKLPISYRLDFAVCKKGSKEVSGWVEFKRRHHKFGHYPTALFSLGKIMHGIHMADTTGLPFFIAVMWDDEVRWMRVDMNKASILWGARTAKTRDAADIEPAAHFPIEHFVRF
jgi:hypothetical protein